MKKQVINTTNAPEAIGPYVQALRVNNMVYTSGQIPIDPATGKIEVTDIEHQTEQVLSNLNQVLRASGSSLHNVIKTTVFLTDMNNFPVLNSVYGRWFTDHKPARSTVAVAALPLGALVEIEALAFVD